MNLDTIAVLVIFYCYDKAPDPKYHIEGRCGLIASKVRESINITAGSMAAQRHDGWSSNLEAHIINLKQDPEMEKWELDREF